MTRTFQHIQKPAAKAEGMDVVCGARIEANGDPKGVPRF